MPYSLKEHIAECYRRAEDYRRLHKRASKSDEREILWITRQRFLLLAKLLEGRLSKLQAVRARKSKKAA